MRERILSLFQQQHVWDRKELETHCQLYSSKQFAVFVKTLNALEEEQLVWNNHDTYVFLDESYMVGTAKNVSKYEFAVVSSDAKVYIRKNKAFSVFEGDQVLVHKDKIIHIYGHTIKKITGTFVRWKKELRFRSDIDYHCSFHVKNSKAYTIRPNTKAVVEIVRYRNPLEVNIVELLGPAHMKGVDITSKLYENNVRQNFNTKVKQEAKCLPDTISNKDRQGRVDYRNLLTVTIDGDDAKDFDDAISIEAKPQGHRLYVHIADVSHYVKENSAIDKEAYARATSVYVTDRVVPMLPFELSNGICSLNPDVDRCTLSCVMEIDEHGHCTSYKILPSLIHSNRRCTYKKVNAVLDGQMEAIAAYSDVLDLIYELNACTKQLRLASEQRGKIDFNTKESLITLNRKGKAVDVQQKVRGWAEEMIEECMILANVCVANYLQSRDLPGMYRVHEKPDPEKVASVCSVAAIMNIPIDFYPEDVTSKQLQAFLRSATDEDAYLVLSMIVLRSMQKAKYDGHCKGHFGLALKEYCHFTSPIRRYPDLIVHRMLRKYLFEHHSRDGISNDRSKILKQSMHVSQKERDAIAVERQVSDMKKAEYMESRIGCQYRGTIVGVQRFGFFVELDNTVEGLVPLHTLYDFYVYDEKKMCLTAETTGEMIRMGQKVKVLCTRVDINKGQVEFALAR